jgi:hypothetical protein
MKIPVDVWLRGTDFAKTTSIDGPEREPAAWTDEDVRLVLEGMLQAMDRQKNPEGATRPIALRSLSWIVNPYEEGGLVIAIEITLGAAIAGPFDADKATLERSIARVILPQSGSPDSSLSTGSIH